MLQQGLSELMDELKENENLTREKLNAVLKIELENNDSLSKEQKESVNKVLNADNDFCVEIVGNKFKEINDFLGKAKELGMDKISIQSKLDDFAFSAKDVQKITTQNLQNSMQNIRKVTNYNYYEKFKRSFIRDFANIKN